VKLDVTDPMIYAARESSTPKLFETHVFGGVLDGEEVGHCTKAEATRS
jgi:hypothetical protein